MTALPRNLACLLSFTQEACWSYLEGVFSKLVECLAGLSGGSLATPKGKIFLLVKSTQREAEPSFLSNREKFLIILFGYPDWACLKPDVPLEFSVVT